ncbi:MAG: DUF5337 domain-containing protein [Shimia sp.]|jgi:hypothetical protein|uniref:DUF5337 domain-containing protein n=1 Tax=unclassified Shimia TaxID=2630038 RepID=UPI0022E768C0|nr:DUF5337 domain-containing protein [Shimia sp. Alg240-R146]
MSGETKDQELARRGRVVALVIAGSVLIWMALNVIGKAAGLPGRFALLFDLAALAALIWALVNIYQIWRARQADEG